MLKPNVCSSYKHLNEHIAKESDSLLREVISKESNFVRGKGKSQTFKTEVSSRSKWSHFLQPFLSFQRKVSALNPSTESYKLRIKIWESKENEQCKTEQFDVLKICSRTNE